MFRTGICRKPFFSIPCLWFRFTYSSVASSPETRQLLADYLINHHQFSIPVASKVSSRIPHLDSFERPNSVINWLKDVVGLSQIQLESVVTRVPKVLSTNLDKTIKPKHKIFEDLGFQPNDVAEIITMDPWSLTNRTADKISTSILVLKNVLGSIEDVAQLLKKCSWFLKRDLNKNLLLNIEFLQKDCGVRPLQIRRLLFNYPRNLLKQPESIKDIVRRVDEMKFGNKDSGMFVHAVRAMSSMSPEKWDAKLELYRSLGISDEDIRCIFRMAPQVLALSDKKIKKGVDLLLGSGKCDLSVIVKHPWILLFSAEKRIKPRLLVFDLLEANNLFQKRPSMPTMLVVNKQDFLRKYVLPYSNVLGKSSLLDKLQ